MTAVCPFGPRGPQVNPGLLAARARRPACPPDPPRPAAESDFSRRLAREVAGHRYAEGGAVRPVKLNLLSLLSQTVIAGSLIAQDPRYLLTATGSAPTSHVRTEQDWLNEQVVRIGLGETLRRVVIDAFYADGICKVALTSPCDAASSAWGVTAGEPGCWPVDFEDWVFDTAASRYGECTFLGHRYRCPLDVAKKMYGSKAKNLAGNYGDRDWNREGDERIGRLTRGYQGFEEFEEHVELWELYLPRHGKVVTLADRDVIEAGPRDKKNVLWEQPWVGAPSGPYLDLGFGLVPGNCLSKAPMMDWFELHMDLNATLRKIDRTVRRLKEVTVYRRANNGDAQALQAASDGDFVPIQDPETMQTIVSAGKALGVLNTMAALYKELFDFASNLSLVGGRKSVAPTATQEKIQNANAGAGMAVMQNRVTSFVAKVGESLLHLAHYHPQLTMASDYSDRASGARATRQLHPSSAYGQGRTPARDYQMSAMKMLVTPTPSSTSRPRSGCSSSTRRSPRPCRSCRCWRSRASASTRTCGWTCKPNSGTRRTCGASSRSAPRPAEGQGGGATETPHDRTLPAQTERTYTRRNVAQDRGSQSQQMLASMNNLELGGANQEAASGVAS
jgi:hypothetical protein